MKLIVTEKPSVAQSIAAVLGTRQRQDGYLEGGGYLVSWCLGHLVEMAAADAYDPAYSKWQMDDLPILPEPWQYVVTPDKKAQFAVLQTLMQRDDVESIVCATDAGREGELIFRLVYEMANCRKPIERLWISSMEESAIEDGFANLRPGAEYDSLYAAALCRSKADWLVGINATRLFSTLYHRTLNVGRVMTPTLALVVERESAIENFKKQKFYTVELDCGFRAVSDRFAQRKDADKLCAACEGQSLTVTAVEQTKKTARPPKLYDLTTLQRDGNRLFGYTAQQVLDYAQALYEKKLLTYPRTDSNYLTEDMADGVPALAEQSAKLLPFAPPYAITDVGRVVNSSKVSDHHALLPTMQVTEDALASLPAGERNVLTLVMVRLLCAIGKIHQYEDTAVWLEQDGVVFTANGRTVIEPGWRATEKAFLSTLKQKPEASEPLDTLPPLTQGQTVSVSRAMTKEGSTTPPKHFTEDTLLSAMEHASAEEFAEIEGVERTGLGTPATRAGVLEKLVKGGFLERKGRQLLPTKKGHNLVVILPESIKSAKLTAEWESALKEVEHGALSPEEFLAGIQKQVSELVACYKNVQVETELFDERESIGACPRCGGSVMERKLSFQCTRQGCGFTMWKNDRFFKDKHKELTESAATALLKKGRVKMSGLFSEKKGTTYDAIVVLADTGRYVNYTLEFEKKPNKNTAGKE